MADKAPIVIDSGQLRQTAAGDVIICPSIKDSALTSGRPVVAGEGGLLGDGPAPLAGTKVYYVADSSEGAATRKLTFVDGILTAET